MTVKKEETRCIDYIYKFLVSVLYFGKTFFENMLLPLLVFYSFIFAFTLYNETIGFSEGIINTFRILLDLYVMAWVAKVFYFCYETLKEIKKGDHP